VTAPRPPTSIAARVTAPRRAQRRE